jgi:predicted ester cyclase
MLIENKSSRYTEIKPVNQRFVFYISSWQTLTIKNRTIMNHKLFYVIGLSLLSHMSYSQNQQEEIDNLKEQVAILQKKDFSLRKSINQNDSITFISFRNTIINAVDKSPKLEFDFSKIVSDIEKDELWTDLVNANNPSSDILGASFTDVVTKAAEKHFLNSLPKKSKPRFMDIVNKIVKNPIVSSILNSNPVTSVVASITNSASEFFSSSVSGRKISKLVVDTENVFDQKKLEEFNKELAPYIEFYDGMILINDNYEKGLKSLQKKYNFLKDDIMNYNLNLLISLGINLQTSTPISTQANNKFDVTKDIYGLNDYRKVLNDQNIKSGKEIADNYIVYQIQVKNFKDEYNSLLETYLKENVRLLANAKGIVLTKGFNPSDIDSLIAKIENYVSKNTVDGKGDKDAFDKMKINSELSTFFNNSDSFNVFK